MITKYLTSLTSTFNPLCARRSHKIPRLVLSFLASDARLPSGGGIAVKSNILPAISPLPSTLTVTFKDGKELKFVEGLAGGAQIDHRFDLSKLRVADVVDEMDRHSRVLQRKDELNSS